MGSTVVVQNRSNFSSTPSVRPGLSLDYKWWSKCLESTSYGPNVPPGFGASLCIWPEWFDALRNEEKLYKVVTPWVVLSAFEWRRDFLIFQQASHYEKLGPGIFVFEPTASAWNTMWGILDGGLYRLLVDRHRSMYDEKNHELTFMQGFTSPPVED